MWCIYNGGKGQSISSHECEANGERPPTVSSVSLVVKGQRQWLCSSLCSSEKYAEVLLKYFHYDVSSRKIKAMLSIIVVLQANS